MADCRVCSAPIIWALDETGAKIPLDEHEQLDYGPARFRIVRDGNPPTVAAVSEESAVRTFVDHRHICQSPRPI